MDSWEAPVCCDECIDINPKFDWAFKFKGQYTCDLYKKNILNGCMVRFQRLKICLDNKSLKKEEI